MITFDEQHSPATEIFDGKDHFSGIRYSNFLNAHCVFAPLVSDYDPSIADNQFAIQDPQCFIDDIMGQDTLKTAVFPFQHSCCPYAFGNGNAQV